jgi:hypothetical protein
MTCADWEQLRPRSHARAVAEPDVWHLRTETEGYMEFVHRRTGEVVVLGAPSPASKCTSRPDCPCDFCVRVRAEIVEGRSEKDEQTKIAGDFLRSYSQTKPAGENSRR